MKKRMTAVWILCLLLCTQWVCFAAQSEPVGAQPDLMRDCSITVHLKTVDGAPVQDGYVQLLQVAALFSGPQGLYYERNAAFDDLTFDPVTAWQEAETAEDLVKTADALEAYAVNGELPYSLAPFNQEGIAAFSNLSPGFYLLMQDESVLESYTAMPPCLVMVPATQDGAYVYDVDCYPKPVTTHPSIEIEFPGEKKIVNQRGQAPADTTFSFVLTPEKPNQPMPKTADSVVDPTTGASVVTRKGAGAFSFGVLPIEKEDIGNTYRYTVHEIKGNALHFSYDISVFTVTVSVTDDGNGEPKATVTISDENKKDVDYVSFTNVYAPPDKPEIPRTGQLWWPVLLLAFAGALLIVIGTARMLRAKRED